MLSGIGCIGAVLPLPRRKGLHLALGDVFKHFPALEFAYGVMLVLSTIYMPAAVVDLLYSRSSQERRTRDVCLIYQLQSLHGANRALRWSAVSAAV